MKVEIKHRFTGAVLYSTEVDDTDTHPVRTALVRAAAARANLARANLARADLARANLARADLAGADLADANLAGANLADARGLTPGAAPAGAPEPYVWNPNPSPAVLAERAARYRARHPEVPIRFDAGEAAAAWYAELRAGQAVRP